MTNNSTNSAALQSEAEAAVHLLDDWFDPIEAGLRDRVREFIQAMIEAELEAALSRPCCARHYGRCGAPSLVPGSTRAAEPYHLRIGWVVTPADLVTLMFVKPGLAPHAGKTYIPELTHLSARRPK